ncbi:hypothetical protein BV898_15581 [Hypsibius exemplaris]|uniref:Gustatory receptor n=1 Tax=Hypsibius exemplaris TaxID=2072580 RepID=A0A9X6RKV1_HYPEX|nr:hypothetical protein BV898_15581 [Hypsibius exemplaris]
MCHLLRACIVISLSLAALCVESAATIMQLQNDTVKYTALTGIIWIMTYPIKTTVTLAVILVFWWNRRAMSSIFERTLPLHGSSKRLGNWAIAFVMFSFLIQSGTRGSEIHSEWTTGKRFYSADLFGLPVTMFEQHAFVLGTRVFTEGVRILCSGYVGMLLNEIRRDLQATSRSISKHTLGVLLITCFLADILSLICVVGELFTPKDLKSRLRLGGSTAMYLFSMIVICRGLIHLSDEDLKSGRAMQKLQSRSVLELLRCRTNCVYTSRKSSPEIVMDRSSRIQSDCLTNVQAKTVCLTTALVTNGFREQSATVALGEFGHISRITVLNVVGLLLTFCCFVLEESNDSLHLEASQLNQTTLQEAAVIVSASVFATNCSELL